MNILRFLLGEGELICNFSQILFVCFSARDRHDIVEPVIYHLKNYGIDIWYDRYVLLLGDNRIEKNINEGAGKCGYVMPILSKHTADSKCAMEEISVIESRYYRGEVTVFPVLYEISPNDLSAKLRWITSLIFKEVDRQSGTRAICNHVACKITGGFVEKCEYKSIEDIVNANISSLPSVVNTLLLSYYRVESANHNSRITLLYATYLTIVQSRPMQSSYIVSMVHKIFERLFSETLLNLTIDYRDLWLLENAICILIDSYLNQQSEIAIT